MREREGKTSKAIMDSKSVKNTGAAGEKGVWRGERTSGIKIRLGVDASGLPHAVRVMTAEVTDREGAVETLRSCAPNLPEVAKVLCDGGTGGNTSPGL
ncbi:MAG: transposase [Treponema sp.]|nr:transposase [Treponema sp.]